MTSCQTVKFCVKTGSSLPGFCLQDDCAALSSPGWGHGAPCACAVADALPSMCWDSLPPSPSRGAADPCPVLCWPRFIVHEERDMGQEMHALV